MKIKTIIAALLIVLPSCLFSQGLTYDEQIYDFGHVGIDFKIQNNFIFVNRTDVPIKILKLNAGCDCTTVKSKDTLVAPGDTAIFKVTFNTKDSYGPINESFSVITDHPELSELEYFYVTIVGQWFNGIKPNPISLFFLQSKTSQNIQVPNQSFDELSIVSVSQSQDYVTTRIITKKASKGKTVDVEVIRNKDLKQGTYYTTVRIVLKTNNDEITMLSIPVKIVIY